jgi:Late competence development protein ComFB
MAASAHTLGHYCGTPARVNTEFSTVHNHNEEAVFRSVVDAADSYPALAGEPGLLADVACVALNRLPARYVRHDVDLNFYMSNDARAKFEAAVKAAVGYAFNFVESRMDSDVPPATKSA